jgi:altronate hydrolase
MLTKDPWIILSAGDNVAVATAAIPSGATVAGIQTREKIDPGHKIALADIRLGQPVVKYGQAIGRTTADVKAGDHIHSHNLHFENDRLAATANSAPEEASAADRARTYMG